MLLPGLAEAFGGLDKQFDFGRLDLNTQRNETSLSQIYAGLQHVVPEQSLQQLLLWP